LPPILEIAAFRHLLGTQLMAAEARPAERSLNPDAMDLYFQGIACANMGATPEYMAQARFFLNVPWRPIPEVLKPWSVGR
jgi:hypothetical protein